MGKRTHKDDFHENGFYDFDRTSAICRDRLPKEACMGDVLRKTKIRPLYEKVYVTFIRRVFPLSFSRVVQ